MAARIHLSRRRGWRKPPGAVVVSRPSKFGNPWRIQDRRFAHADGSPFDARAARKIAREMCLRDFEAALDSDSPILGFTRADVRRELAGKDLCCWCPLDQPCHADILLRVANP